MRDLQGKVAVVTGAASGIGRACASAFAREGMKVVLSDWNSDQLDAAVTELQGQGRDVIGVQADVSDYESVQALADAAKSHFGGVHLLHNNAGVTNSCPILETPLEDMHWMVNVNLWGPIHGMKAFAPLLIEQDESHLINTSSFDGLVANGAIGTYDTAKFGVVGATESVLKELRANGHDHVGVTLLLPGPTASGIVANSEASAADAGDSRSEETKAAWRDRAGAATSQGMTPADTAEVVLDAVLNNRYWCCTMRNWDEMIRARTELMLTEGAILA